MSAPERIFVSSLDNEPVNDHGQFFCCYSLERHFPEDTEYARVAPIASAPAGWMDIESAPRDGTEFVAANANQGFVKCLLNWDTIHGYWESKGKPMLHMQYTHWHALPEKPAPPEAGRMVTKEGGVGV